LEVVKSAYKRVSRCIKSTSWRRVAGDYEPTQLALATHPDKNPDNEAATQEFQQISEAYRVLAAYLDKSSHRHEYADSLDGFDDDDDDYDYDDEGYLFLDLENLQFYL